MIIAIVMLLVGLGIILVFGGVGVYALYQTNQGRRQADESQGWAGTFGSIVESRLDQSTNYSEDGPTVSYSPRVRYTYSVIGQPFTGEKITFGLTEAHSRSSKAQEVLDRYPPGKQVTVYYDPNDPSQAVLERRAGGGMAGWVLGIVFLVAGLCFGCLIIGIGLFLTTARVSGG